MKEELDMVIFEDDKKYIQMDTDPDYPLIWNGTSDNKKIKLHLLNDEYKITFNSNELFTNRITEESIKMMYQEKTLLIENIIEIEVSDVFQKVVIFVPEIISEILFIPEIIFLHPTDVRTESDINFIKWVMPIKCILSYEIFDIIDDFIYCIQNEQIIVGCYEQHVVVNHIID